MTKGKNGKGDDGQFESDEAKFHTPKSKGGRTGASNCRNHNPNFMKNLKPWKPGQSGNLDGLSKEAHDIQALARELTPDLLIMLNGLAHDPGQLTRDRIAAADIVIKRSGPPPGDAKTIDVSPSSALVPVVTEDGEPATALLMRAVREEWSEERVIAELKAELRKREDKLAKDKEDHEDRMNGYAAARQRGEKIPGVIGLLLEAKEETGKEH